MAHRTDDAEQKPPAPTGDQLGTRALIIFSLIIAVPWFGFQILEDDPAQRPAMLDTAIMGVLGAWLMRFGVGAVKK